MKPDHHRIDWHGRYLAEMSAAELVLAKIANAVFTVWSVLLHLIIYPIALAIEGGDFHLFLDAISIEAVFVSLCVGINTKLQMKGDRIAQQQRDHMQESIEQKVEADQDLTQSVRDLTDEIHRVVVPTPKSTDGSK